MARSRPNSRSHRRPTSSPLPPAISTESRPEPPFQPEEGRNGGEGLQLTGAPASSRRGRRPRPVGQGAGEDHPHGADERRGGVAPQHAGGDAGLGARRVRQPGKRHGSVIVTATGTPS